MLHASCLTFVDSQTSRISWRSACPVLHAVLHAVLELGPAVLLGEVMAVAAVPSGAVGTVDRGGGAVAGGLAVTSCLLRVRAARLAGFATTTLAGGTTSAPCYCHA